MDKKTAAEMGLYKYMADTPCRRGHLPWRYTNTGRCVACKSLYRVGIHKVAPIRWVLIEERVHTQDLAAVREYCKTLRDNREALSVKYEVDSRTL